MSVSNLQLCITIAIPTLTIVLTSLDTRRNMRRSGDKVDLLAETLTAKLDTLLSPKLDTSLTADLRTLRMEIIAYRRQMREDMALFHKLMVNPGTEL